MEFEARCWQENEFSEGEIEWQRLLATSSADPLFNSWAWLNGWWRNHRQELRARLKLIAIYRCGVLVGLVPLYEYKVTHRRFLAASRLSVIGTAWRDASATFSEYVDIIANKAYAREVVQAAATALLADRRWDDFVVGNTRQDGLMATLVRGYFLPGCYVREADPLTSHVAKLPSHFDAYLANLDGNVRRKVWNHRSKLANPEQREFTGTIAEFFSKLDALHLQRWGRCAFGRTARQFHLEFAQQAANAGQLSLTEFIVDGKAVSFMYNYRVGNRVYNIQSAFDLSGISGCSPGYLHLGYAIEQACRDGVTDFDLLGGVGRSRDYKKDFNTERRELISLQVIRARALAWLYRLYDRRFASLIGLNAWWILPGFDDFDLVSLVNAVTKI